MARPIAVLRPEPGNRVTAAAIEARGHMALRLPLFAARAVAWDAPGPDDHDALIVTSANAIRHGGAQLGLLKHLPFYAVGEATAEAAKRAGFDIAAIGTAGSEALLAIAGAAGVERALHLAGRERSIEAGGIVAKVVTVYSSDALHEVDAALLAGSIAMIQSARAGARLAELVQGRDRAGIAIVAIGARAADALGAGWERVVIPAGIDNKSMIDAAIALAD